MLSIAAGISNHLNIHATTIWIIIISVIAIFEASLSDSIGHRCRYSQNQREL